MTTSPVTALKTALSLAILTLAAACGSPKSSPPPPAPTTSATPSAGEPDAGASAAENDASTASPPSAASSASSAESDPQAALATAKKDGKPTLLVFCAKWVAACGELSHVLAESNVKKTLDEKYVVARVDVSNEDDPSAKERMKRYNVKGLPSLIVFDRKGKEVGRESGNVDSAKVTKLLDRAK